jgi:pantoate kinase
MHSLGLGLTVAEGVSARVTPADIFAARFNGEEVEFPTVRSAVEALTGKAVAVDLQSSLSLASGFGLSGASALAAAHAVNQLLDLGLTDRNLAMAAHVAEVENLTGLGDVCAQFHGGCLAKLQEGDPLKASVLPVKEQPISFRFYGPIKTSEIIGDPRRHDQINRAADAALGELALLLQQQEENLNAYIELSKRFANESGLLVDARVRTTIEEIEADGGSASMIMLGNAVFSTRPFEGSREIALSSRKAGPVDE